MKFSLYPLLFTALLLLGSCTKENQIQIDTPSPEVAQPDPIQEMDLFLGSLNQQEGWTEALEMRYDELEQKEFAYLDDLQFSRGLVSAHILNVPGDYATIQAAVDAATSGDIVLVAAGIYNESSVDIDGLTNVRIVANGNVTLNGQFNIQQGSQFLIKGFTINSTFDGFIGIVVQTINQIEGLRLINNTIVMSNALCEGITFFSGAGNSIVKKNTISFAANSNPFAGILIPSGNNNRIAGNSIHYGTQEPAGAFEVGISMTNSNSLVKKNVVDGAYHGIEMDGGNNNVISRNEVANSAVHGMLLSNGSANNQVLDNTVSNSGDCDIQNSGGPGNTEAGNTADCIAGF